MMKKSYLLILLLVVFAKPLWPSVSNAEHKVYLSAHSKETVEWNIALINQAQQSIEFSPCFCGGKVLQDLLSAIEGRLQQRPSLQVYILASDCLFKEADVKKIDHLKKTYPKQFHLQITANVISAISFETIENHVKCLVVDEKYFMVGGTNYDERFCADGLISLPSTTTEGTTRDRLPGGSRDQDLIGCGPIAKEIREKFFQLYSLWEQYAKTAYWIGDPAEFRPKETHYYPISAGAPIAVVEKFDNCPELIKIDSIEMILSTSCDHKNPITEAYIKKIDGAKESISIGNLYCFPPDNLLKSLQRAVNRDVELSYITNGAGESAPYCTIFFCWANRMNFVPLIYGRDFNLWQEKIAANSSAKNVSIYEYNIKNILFHKKVMVVDKRHVFVGSYNFGYKSTYLDFEMVLIMDSPALAKRLQQILDIDKSNSTLITPKQARGWYFDPIKMTIAESQKKMRGMI